VTAHDQPAKVGWRAERREGWHRFLGTVQPLRWQSVVRALVAAMGVAAICWYFGADVWHSLLFGSILTTVGLVLSSRWTLPNRGDTDWRGDALHVRAGSRNDVAELSWSLETSYGRVSRSALSTVQQLARRRLAMHQLDPREATHRAQIEQLVGGRAYVLLVSRGRRRPYLRSLLHCLDALDAIEPARPTRQPQAASGSRQTTSIHPPDLARKTRER
jgi:cell division protein FtsL